MATLESPRPGEQFELPSPAEHHRDGLEWLLMPLHWIASLKLTIALFAMAIVLIFIGTLAQVDKDIWEVVHAYFRIWIARVDFQVFFPSSFFPSQPQVPGWFPFPGGKTIGLAMLVNLLSAHLLRFKIQARGKQLLTGLGVLAVGFIATWLVVESGSNKNGILELPWIDWHVLWDSLTAVASVASIAIAATIFGALRRAESHQWARQVVLILLLILLAKIFVASTFSLVTRWYPGDPAMRIVWQLSKGFAAAGVLLAGCALLFNKRAGVVLLHGGVALMMLNEFVVSMYHVEAQMPLAEGQTVSWVQDIRDLELAIIDRSDPKEDDVVVVPASRLIRKTGQPLSDAQLPFDIKLDRFLRNSDWRPRKGNEPTAATAGLGLDWIAEPRTAGAGADSDNKLDLTAAYVTLYRKGTTESLGTYLVGLPLALRDLAEVVTVGDKSYDIYLRYRRDYKPYSVHLLDVKSENYPGTNKPKTFESHVRMVDPSRNVDRSDIKIWMNNPLRFGDETFYQSGYHLDPTTNTEYTTLQVVSNTGWMIPYVACAIVIVGMGAHFLITLMRFLGRQLETEAAARAERAKSGSRAQAMATGFGAWAGRQWKTIAADFRAQPAAWYVPVLAALVLVLYFSSKTRIPHAASDKIDINDVGRLPVQYEGRVQPLDTLARTILRQISDKQTYYPYDPSDDEQKTLSQILFGPRKKSQPAIAWLMEVATDSEKLNQERVFRIENLDVLNTLGLSRRSGFRYSASEIRKNLDAFQEQVHRAQDVDPKHRDTFQHKLLETARKFSLYMKLYNSFHPQAIPEFPTPEEIRDNPTEAQHKLRASLEQTRMAAEQLKKSEPPMLVPIYDGEKQQWIWLPYANAIIDAYVKRQIDHKVDDSILMLSRIINAYANNDVTGFHKATDEYQRLLDGQLPATAGLAQAQTEWFYNTFDPLGLAQVGYIMAFVVLALGWLGWTRPLNRTALAMIVVVWLLHTIAVVMRIYISGRPPVTNLYSAAVFIGWGAVLIGIVLELIFRLGVGNLVAAVAGYVMLQIASSLAGSGDTFTVLQAVLDTQFWLATHVVCITFGYLTTYVAGLLGIILLGLGLVTLVGRVIRPNFKIASIDAVTKSLDRMMYGVLCFAIFFSFVGTVLGGLWADDSWGRFWGWDPKENGALIIVLWNALVLHARWDKLVGPRGTALLAVGGNIVTSWSFFGVNELGAGLHSYGFTEGVLLALSLFCGSQLLIMFAGALLPRSLWTAGAPAKAAT